MSKTTACPLDCYDACGIVFENGKIKPALDKDTQGFLCSKLNHYDEYEQITKPRYKGKDITLDEALSKLVSILKDTQKGKFLHYRGNGNFALMQESTDYLFASMGAVLTNGSLCDGAGEAGILAGRGVNKILTKEQISKSDVVIFWGRNPHTTSSHLLPFIKDKTIIVIDPIKTKIAQNADLHIQIKPHGDLKFAMLLSRFLNIENSCDEEYLSKFGSEFEEFYEFTQTLRIKATLDEIGLTLGDIGDVLSLVKDKKVSIICGVGIQKYRDGADVLRAIDAFGVALGLFGKEGCGVAYLGDSKASITSPFSLDAKRVSKVDTEFEKFDTTFIQGSNPLSQMPNTKRVEESISKVKNLIYFGLYENETSAIADLVIPAKSFLAKSDVRSSYGDNQLLFMDKVMESDIGISEYDLSAFVAKEFKIDFKSEEFYLNHFKSFKDRKIDEIAYENGFDTDDGEFVFLDEIESDFDTKNGYFLITPKAKHSLNSQFRREKYIYLNEKAGFIDGDIVEVSSKIGSVELEVRVNADVREDCVLIYSGTKGINHLTTSKISYDGNSAVYQEEKIKLKRIEK